MAEEEKNKTEEQEAQVKPETAPVEATEGEADNAEEVPMEVENGPEAEASTDAAEEAAPEEPVEEIKPEEANRKIETGMVVRVHVKIKDVTPRGDERERIQVFEGTVISKKGRSPETATITVRKVSNGVGVERIFPLMMPAIEKIDIIKKFRTRRGKLYFLRGKFKKRLKEVPVDKE